MGKAINAEVDNYENMQGMMQLQDIFTVDQIAEIVANLKNLQIQSCNPGVRIPCTVILPWSVSYSTILNKTNTKQSFSTIDTFFLPENESKKTTDKNSYSVRSRFL